MAQARYVTGNVMGHLMTLASTSAIGMLAIFAVDLADMYFISLLGVPELAAAVGFSGVLFFLTASIGMALSVASSSLVSQALGREDATEASQSFLDVSLFGFLLGSLAAVGFHFSAPWLLNLLGATDSVHELAVSYFRTVNMTLPLLILGMTSGAALRASGMVRYSLIATLSGGAVNALLDPLFIFGFNMGLDGAALATVCSRFVVITLSLRGAILAAGLLKGARPTRVLGTLGPVLGVAVPSLITSLSTPIAGAYVTSKLAPYGPEVIAGVSVFGRILPLAFAGLFTVSMALAPIIGQNFGARQFGRLQEALRSAALFSIGYTLIVSTVLAVLAQPLADLFGLDGEGKTVLVFYCRLLAFSYCFYGFHLAASQCFTNTGRPGYSTLANLTRDLLFMLPLVAIGGALGGVKGILLGQYGATVLSGSLGLAVAWWMVQRLEQTNGEENPLPRLRALSQAGLFHRPVTAHSVPHSH